MKPTRLIGVALRSILKNKMRTLLTMLGVVIGVGAVIVMVAIGEGAQSKIRAQIDNLGTNMIVVTPGSSSQGGVSQGAGSLNRLTVEDAEALKSESFLLSAVSPSIVAPTQVVGGQGNWRSAIFGVATDYQLIRDWPVSSGRLFDESEVRSMRKVAVIGTTVAEALFPGEDPVGQQIRLRNVPFEVIGLLTEKGQTAEGSDQDDVVLAPYTTVKNRLSGRSFIAQILASTATPDDVAAAQEEISSILRERHGLADWEADDFTVRNQTDLAATAEETTEVMTLLLAAIASISLLVGGIGIMNIMLVSVSERTREIGLRLALGARSSDVLRQFLVESTVLSVLGGLIGVGLGVAGATILGRLTGWATLISLQTVLVSLGFAASVGIFFGFWPSRRAAALDPIEALRYE